LTSALDDEPPHYGMVKNIGIFNPIRIAFHEWAAIAHDLAAMPRRGREAGRWEMSSRL
jgi:hypothetical protein